MRTETVDAKVDALCGDIGRIRAPRGTELNARSWSTEAPLRMLLNNLDPEVAEHPEELVVYGGSGKAARNAAKRFSFFISSPSARSAAPRKYPERHTTG